MSQSCQGEHLTAPSLFATRTPFAPSRPTPAEALREREARPQLSPSVRYGLIRRPDLSLKKPVAFGSLAELAAALHRDRAGAGLELADAALLLRGEDQPRLGVSVWAQGEDGARARFLGWAYLGGAGRQVLQDALFAACPQPWAA